MRTLSERLHEYFETMSCSSLFPRVTFKGGKPWNVKFNPLPDFGDHMPINEFIECVKTGGFIDYDGHGRLATQTEESDVLIYPSDINPDWKAPEWATHVMWFNK
jgi:hypothetical protein